MARGHKTGGRTAGTANKVTGEMRELLQRVASEYAAGQLHLDMAATDPETRLRLFVEVSKLVTPKPPQIAGFDGQERPIFTGIALDVEERRVFGGITHNVDEQSRPILSIDPLDDGTRGI